MSVTEEVYGVVESPAKPTEKIECQKCGAKVEWSSRLYHPCIVDN